MQSEQFETILQQKVAYIFTTDQKNTIEKIHHLLYDTTQRILIIRGYAGTGKTSLIGALVKSAQEISRHFVLLAPTGRAAKVQTLYTKQTAYTIHKKIYKRSDEDNGFVNIQLQPNIHKNAVFVVDEASMIPDWQASQGLGNTGQSLMNDLFTYIFSGFNCKLILVGDNAQLPPIGSDKSPALEKSYIEKNWPYTVNHIQLREVVRQLSDSGILENATNLRNVLLAKTMPEKIELKLSADVQLITGYELEDVLNSSYSKQSSENVLVVCRSNKTANQYNGQIRARIKWLESEIAAGDTLMVVKNNYFWLPKESKMGFIANGDTIQIQKVVKHEEKYGFRFATILAQLTDYDDEPEMEVKIMLDVLNSAGPSLESEQQKLLYQSVLEDYMDIASKAKRMKAVREDPYLNALQVKFAYAVTCHKSQGGQWKHVFIDHGFLNEKNWNFEFIRWLYTAITRASEKIYLVNFSATHFNLS